MRVLHGLSPHFRHVFQGGCPELAANVGFRTAIVAFAIFARKGAILYSVGASAYQDRVARLEAGEGFDRLGAWMMQADPLTQFMAGQIAHAMLQIQK